MLSGRAGSYRMEILKGQSDISTDWDVALPESFLLVNNRIIPHLRYSPAEILVGMSKEMTNLAGIDPDTHGQIQPLARAQQIVKHWTPPEQSAIVFNHMVQLCQRREQTREASAHYKKAQAERVNRGRYHSEFNIGSLVMVRQHTPSKFAPRYRDPFIITAP